MKLLQETTVWSTNTPNHIYIFDDVGIKTIGYIKAGTVVAIKFNVPMGFDRRRREFVQLKKADIKQQGLDLSAFN